jgi:hypothetical protein
MRIVKILPSALKLLQFPHPGGIVSVNSGIDPEMGNGTISLFSGRQEGMIRSNIVLQTERGGLKIDHGTHHRHWGWLGRV